MGWLPPRRGDVLAAILAVLLLIFAVAAMTLPRHPTNRGFGPEWKCTGLYRTSLMCFKDVP